MGGFTTDKVGHGYLPTYLALAGQLPAHPTILEIGVAGGDSLRMWQALLPYARGIVGVDHHSHAVWPDGTHRVVADQADVELPSALPYTSYDLIIDDASHDNARTRKTWSILWGLVKPGGWYVVEDWSHCGGLIREFAGDLIDCFHESRPLAWGVESITYRAGMILIRREQNP